MESKKEIVELLYKNISIHKNKLNNFYFKMKLIYSYNNTIQYELDKISAIANITEKLLITNQLSRAIKYLFLLTYSINELDKKIDAENVSRTNKFFIDI